MKAKTVCGIVLGLTMATATAWAQSSGGDQDPKYDTSSVTTIQGEVVQTGASGIFGLGGEQEMTVRTDRESLPVILGPKNYLDTQNVRVEKGEKVTVTGSRVILDDKPTIIAREVKKENGDVLTLRNMDGTPAWTQSMEPTPMQSQGQMGTSGGTGQEQGGAMSGGQAGTGTGTGMTQEGMPAGCPTPMMTPMMTPASGTSY